MTIFMKKEFADLGHIKSGRFYVSKSPYLSPAGKKSGLFLNLNYMSFLYPCGATYQRCYPTVPMIRFGSSSIDDLSPHKDRLLGCFPPIDGYPVAYKNPSGTNMEWLNTFTGNEQIILNRTKVKGTKMKWGYRNST